MGGEGSACCLMVATVASCVRYERVAAMVGKHWTKILVFLAMNHWVLKQRKGSHISPILCQW